MRGMGWKIRSSKKWFEFRRKKNRHRPAAGTRHRLQRGHIDGIHIRPLLAIDFDRDEKLIQDICDLLVLETFSLHHVAPMAGAVSDRKKNRLVLRACFFECLLAPWEPLYRIVGVLEKIRRFLAREAICVVV